MSNGLRVAAVHNRRTTDRADSEHRLLRGERRDRHLAAIRKPRGGAAINTSGTQSGTHTVQAFPYGAGDGSTTFNVPDKRGRVSVGRDDDAWAARQRPA